MVKIIEALSDVVFERLDNGKATKIEKASVKPAEFMADHMPKTSNFISKHYNKMAVAFDIIFAADMLWIGYNTGRRACLKDLCGPLTFVRGGIGLSDDNLGLKIVTEYTTKKGIDRTFTTTIKNQQDLVNIAEKCREALKAQGIDYAQF